jgi:hypothetical protein
LWDCDKIVETFGCFSLHIGLNVGICVQREGNTRMSQPLLNDFWMFSRSEQKRRGRVPKIVETNSRKARAFQYVLEVSWNLGVQVFKFSGVPIRVAKISSFSSYNDPAFNRSPA